MSRSPHAPHAFRVPLPNSRFWPQAGGFTLLEICLAIFITLLIVAAAVPSLSGLSEEKKARAVLDALDGLAQEARARSVEEQRPYVLLWSDEGVALLPDGAKPDPANEGTPRLKLAKGDSLTLELPAALVKTPPPVWTFWPAGICEPAIVHFKNKRHAWTAVYNPFTAQAEVTNE